MSDNPDRFRARIFPCLLLLLATIAVYGRILGHDFQVTWDDNIYVYANKSVHGFSWENVRIVFSSYYVGNYAPVQMLSYMLDYEFWGLKAGGFLFTNILLHAVNGLLVYRLFLSLHRERLWAIVGALIFIVHPVQVESVAWVSQRKNLLAMLFFLLAWEAYRRYRTNNDKGRIFYILSVSAFVLALLAKSAAVILPAVIILYDFCFPVSGNRRYLLDKIPYIVIAVTLGMVTMQSQLPEDGEWFVGGGRNLQYHGGSPLATFITMLPVFCRYLGMLVWPAGLSPLYAVPIRQSIDPVVVGSALLLAAVLVLCLRIFRAGRKLGFWTLYFVLALAPVSQIVPLITLMNDRYLYFPIIGVAALGGAGAVVLRDHCGHRLRIALYASVSVILVLLAAVSFQRAADWKNPVTLWRPVVARHPDLALPWEFFGNACLSMPGMKGEAIFAYRRAIEINPSSEIALSRLAYLYVESGEYDKGYAILQRLLDVYPDHVQGLVAIGDVYLYWKDYSRAETSFKKAQSLQPDAIQIIRSFGDLALARGELLQARIYYGQVEAGLANDVAVAFRLASLEARAGHGTEALGWLEKALQRGFADYGKVRDNHDFAVIRSDPRFERLLLRFLPEEQLRTREKE